MANNFLDKVKQLIGGIPQSLSNIGQSLNDNQGWFQQGKFTPIKAAQQGIQNWATKNPTQAQNIINTPSNFTQAVTEPIASIPYRMADYQKSNLIPVDYNKLRTEGNLWDKKINSLPVAQQQPVANLIWGEQDSPTPTANSSANLFPSSRDSNIPKTNPRLEAIKQQILSNPNIRPSAKEYLSKIPVTFQKSDGTWAGQAMGGGQINPSPTDKYISVSQGYNKPGTDQAITEIIKHELLHEVPSLIPTTLFHPKNKEVVNAYTQRWGKQYMKNPGALVNEMFAERDLPPAYYWHVFKEVNPKATKETFISYLKSYFVNNINNPQNSVQPSNTGTSVPNSGGQLVQP